MRLTFETNLTGKYKCQFLMKASDVIFVIYQFSFKLSMHIYASFGHWFIHFFNIILAIQHWRTDRGASPTPRPWYWAHGCWQSGHNRASASSRPMDVWGGVGRRRKVQTDHCVCIAIAVGSFDFLFRDAECIACFFTVRI